MFKCLSMLINAYYFRILGQKKRFLVTRGKLGFEKYQS
jgi:hypothetical protein